MMYRCILRFTAPNPFPTTTFPHEGQSADAKCFQRVGYYVEVPPEELGELPWGHPDHHPDLHCTKYRFISPKMQEEQEIAEKKLYKQFVEEPVQDPEWRAMFLIPKTNLRIPYNWFWHSSDAAAFIRAVAKANNVGVHTLGKSTMGTSLLRLMNVVWERRDLRMKQEEDPPRMSLQERRDRHWEAVTDGSSVVRGFSLRLIRHVTLMLVGASFDFAKSNGRRSQGKDLSGIVEKLRDWFEENDPEDLKAFEYLQPERQQLPDDGMSCPSFMAQVLMCMVNKTVQLVGFQPQRRGWAPGYEKGPGNPGNRKRTAGNYRPSFDLERKADTYRPPPDPERKTDTYRPAYGCKRKADIYHPTSDFRSKRQRQARLDDDIEPPKRISEGKRGKRRWGQRA